MAATSPEETVDLALAMVTRASTATDWLVILPLVIPLMTGAVLVMLRHRMQHHPLIAGTGLAALLVVDGLLLLRVLENGPVVMMMGSWLPPFGIAFEADLLGATLATVSALVALAVAIEAAPTVGSHERRYGFYPFMMLLMTGVTGAFLTGDIFNLYVWFEVLLISSFGLLVLGSEQRQIDATVRYGVLNLLATTLFLIATGLLYGTLGTLNMADIAVKARSADAAGPLVTIAALFLVAFGMKAAAFPLNFWLPASYHAPGAGVSALFAGLLTKVGIYALLKTLVLLLGVQALSIAPVVAWSAGLTMVVGALGALAQTEIRRTLNWLVVSGIGYMMIGVAVPSELALTGSIFYAVHSMIVMAALYLAAGVMEDVAGTGDLRRLGGLWHRSAIWGALVLALLLSAAGVPPFSGFWPKAVLVDATLAADAPWLAAAVLVSGFLTTLAGARVFLFAVWRGGPEGTPDGAVAEGIIELRPPAVMRLIPPAALGLVMLAIGLVPAPLHALAAGAAAGLLDPAGFAAALFGPAP
jgi:multicomponent Na+:H+ antiporter subunit D